MGIEGIPFILSSGCDLPPDTPEENPDTFIHAALSLKG
jgi:uroporphyrinogen-III decarboxylase